MNYETTPFEAIRRTNPVGNEFWSSRDFPRVLGHCMPITAHSAGQVGAPGGHALPHHPHTRFSFSKRSNIRSNPSNIVRGWSGSFQGAMKRMDSFRGVRLGAV